jgi:hypothetical protein
MSQTNTLARSLHDVGLAAWFGGSLMGAVGLNGAAAEVDQPGQRARVANAGWARWTPANLAAIAAHVAGGAIVAKENKGRVAAQKGVARMTFVKAGLTAAALGVTAYSRMLGQKMMNAGDVPVEGATEPDSQTPDRVAGAQRQLKVLQWAVPALTGTLLVLNSRMGEQQRPVQVVAGIAKRILPDSLADRIAA